MTPQHNRAVEVLQLIADGFTPDAIARKVKVSKGTVSRDLKQFGTSYPQARRHFRNGGTVEQLAYPKPEPLPLFLPTQLDRIEAKLDQLLKGLKP